MTSLGSKHCTGLKSVLWVCLAEELEGAICLVIHTLPSIKECFKLKHLYSHLLKLHVVL